MDIVNIKHKKEKVNKSSENIASSTMIKQITLSEFTYIVSSLKITL